MRHRPCMYHQLSVSMHFFASPLPAPQVAGAAAAAGLSLKDVTAEAAAAAAAVGSMGVATSACTLPGGQPSERSFYMLLVVFRV